MIKTFFFCALLFFTTTQAQVTISAIKNPSTGYGSNLVFPYIKSIDPKTGKTINAHLQSKMLDNSTVITNPHKIFFNRQYINTDTLSQSGYSELSYKVVMNTSRVLSLQFDVEATGAYSSYYNEYYSFDPARPCDTDLDIVIPIRQLQKYLTDYGRKLLL